MDFEKERREAVYAGNRALNSLNAAYSDLRSARSWGFLDLFSSRSLLTGLIKHSKLQNAQQHMDQARADLSRFSRELNDVSRMCDLNVNISDFLSFADVFMDNFFVDWAVQNRISRAAEQVEQAIRMVRQVLDRLGAV